MATPKGAYQVNLSSGDLGRVSVKLLAEGALGCIELSHCTKYIACGGKDRIVLIEAKSNKQFW